MTAVVAFLAVALVVLLIVLTHVRRRRIRAHLLRAGTQVAGRASLVGRGRAARIAVRYRDSGGVERKAIKVQPSARDDLLAASAARVLFDPQRTSRSDYVLVGFGPFPARWFPVQFDRKAA